MNYKKIIAITFALIMVLSGLAVLSSDIHTPSSITTSPPVPSLVASGTATDEYYGDTSTWNYTVSGSSTSSTSAMSTSAYPAPDYPAYPAAPSTSSWTLSWDGYTLGSGNVSSYDITHSQTYTHTEFKVGSTIHYQTTSHSTTSWKFSVQPSYTWTQYGSLSGVSAGWTLELDSKNQTGTIVLYSALYSSSFTVSGPTYLKPQQDGTFTSSVPSNFTPSRYQWYLDGSAISGATSSLYTTSFSASTDYSIFFLATNSTGFSYKSTTLNGSAGYTLSISAIDNPADASQSVDFSTSVSGGSGTYSYSYVLYDGTSTSDSELDSGTTSSFDYTFSSSGTYLLVYSSTDSNGFNASSSLIQTVNSDPSVSITSSQNPTDTGKTVEFSSSVSGGTSPYNYTWSADGTTYYTKDINVTFTSSGTYTIDLTVSDAADYSVSTSMSETVNSDPVVSASSNVSSADVNYPIEFCSTPSGGTGPYNESWALNGNVISTSQDFSHSFSSSGSYTLTVTVTDGVGVTSSASVTVTINPNPSVTIYSSQNPTDSGNSVTFTSSVSGGTGADTYNWTVNGVQESTASSFPYSFSTSGVYYVNLTVTDSDGHTAFSSLKETVNPDPSVSIKVIHNPTDAYVWANFSAVISGGTGPYNKTWTINGENFYSDYVNYTFTSPGTFTVSLKITDANGNTASASVSEVVNPDPSAKINSEFNPVDQGVNDTLTAEISGGTGPYNTTWSEGSEILNYSSSFHMAFSSTGTYVINLTVVDSLGESYKTSISIKVIEKPSALIEGPNETDVSTETYWEAFGSFGTAPYDDYWYINGVNTSSGLYLEYAFPNTGKFNITLLIVDSQGAKAYTYLNVTVNPLPKVSISVSSSTTDTGLPVAISGIVSGGTGPFNYSISVSSIGIVGYSSSLDYEFPSGQYNITITVYDADGNSAHASISIIVNSLPSVSITSKYPNIDVNTTDVFNATISGGTAPYVKALWYINNSYLENGTSISYSFSSPGVYSLKIIIYDSLNVSASNIIDITVVKYPESSIIASHKNIDAHVPDSFRAETSGGIGPYKDEFLIAGHIFYNSSIPYSFTTPGTYTVELIVSDYFGKDANSYINITVYPDPEIDVYWNGTPTVSEGFKLYSNVTGGIGPYSVSWIFSDQDESGFNVSHIFSLSGPNTFEVKLSDSSGYTVTKNYTIYVNLYVSIAANTTRGLGPLSVQFSSSVLGGSDYSFNWTFSAGHYSLEQNPLYTFPAGNYTVHFTVTSANGAKGYANISIFSLPPPVSITYSTDRNITQYFYFNATANWDAGSIYNMTWSFPNGQSLTGLSISYYFPVYNEFNTVVATFGYNNQTYTEDLNVRMVPATPSVNFTPPSIIPVNTMLSLNATATAPDSNSFTYSWFIDGSSYSGQNQLYYFDNTGNISISVTVTDGLGASATDNKTIDVVPEGKSSSIAISYTKQSAGAMEFYNIKVVSSNGIVAVEAFLSTTELNISEISSSYTSSGEVAHFNITMNQRDYSAGTYSISIVAFNNNSQSNHISAPFTVTSNYASASGFSLGDLITFFGGISNFIIVLLTLGGLIIAYAGMHASRDPDVVIQEGTGKKRKDIVLQGRRKR
ncbi:MAG: PKD domain-containing protein [Ferroplasma sp.]|uniref:PKD domain-containing protein n=1 Tax=Ferroplasma sp. TaxID=2591003 RepID=UPI0028152162|nr:PKD domain-containing protein [Ferroplasma sp.]WMT52301.1 MAG: PKD domain-containing protein [Ferroplasma sp.]WMT52302.1 MAG: PKD domain-containing protein [Ferroplasma sp.]